MGDQGVAGVPAAGVPAAEPSLLFLCTGNAARSVMAGFMCEWLGGARGRTLRITTAGTHVAEGQPMSMRTRAAMESIPELAGVAVHLHRSHQLVGPDLDSADIVVAMEADHVRYVRRRHPGASSKTATLRRLCRDLERGAAPLADRVAAMGLAGTELGPDEDVVDPAGGDEDVYVACAAELWHLCGQLVDRL